MSPTIDDLAQLVTRARECERSGRAAEAEAIYRGLLAAHPRHAAARFGLGKLLADAGRWTEAREHLAAAVAAAPTVAAHHRELGRALLQLKEGRAALAVHAIAVQLAPRDADTWCDFAIAQWKTGRFAAAEASSRRAIECDPELPRAHNILAQVLFYAGRVEESVARLQAFLARRPATMSTRDMLLFTIHFHPDATRASLAAEHAAWNTHHCVPLRAERRRPPNDRSPERRLRIGYVSPNLVQHPVANPMLSLLRHRDRQNFEVFAYFNARESDEVTARLRATADRWRDVATWSDEQLTECIRADGIDVLVDLSLHMTDHRLLVFARKPAPIQVTFAGYPGTTGLETIDYRLTDRFVEPPEWTDAAGSEQPVRLPDSFWIYDPLSEEPAVNPSPALARGGVTFGCLAKCAKVNAGSIALWARVLHAVPDSRLALREIGDESQARLRRLLEQNGVDPARLDFLPWQPHAGYLAQYHRIDIALDPVPYGGHTTLIDGLWMGVPTLALPGETPVARAAVSLLTNAGLADWIATSPEDFVRRAVQRAGDLAGLAALRVSLRQKLRESPLMDGPRFARGIEDAYRAMWRRWCAQAGATPDSA